MNLKRFALQLALVTAAASFGGLLPAGAATPNAVSRLGSAPVVAMGRRAPNATDDPGDLPPDERLGRDLQDPSKTTTPADVFIPGSTVPVRQDNSNDDGN